MKTSRIIVLGLSIAGISAALLAQQGQPQLPEPSQPRPNQGSVVPRPEGAMPKVPAGFTVDMYADNVPGARLMVYAPNGDLFVTQTQQSAITIFRDTNKDGMPDERIVYAQGAAGASRGGGGRGGPGGGRGPGAAGAGGPQPAPATPPAATPPCT